MTAKTNDERLWDELCAAENRFFEARMRLQREVVDLSSVLAAGLARQPGTALRYLESRPEEEIRNHVAALVELACVGSFVPNIALARSVLQKIDRAWLVENIDPIASKCLATGDDWEFRRIAELYELLDPQLLQLHVQRCASHDNAEIRGIADDFARGRSV